MASAESFSYSQSAKTLDLNNEQIHALLNKLSSDEQKELTEVMRNCTTEITTQRGLPVTAAVLGSLYFARTRLPAQYHFGPKGWPFYAIMGIASLTATNFVFMGTCRDRIKPRIDQLWKKYDLAKSSANYDEIRRHNRNVAPGSSVISQSEEQRDDLKTEKLNLYATYNVPSSQDSSQISSLGDSFTTYKPLIGETSEFYQHPPRARRPLPPNDSPFAPEISGLMSGTPSGGQKTSDGLGLNDDGLGLNERKYTFS